MARCAGCEKSLGLFGKRYRLDRQTFCDTCAVAYFEQRRVRVLQELLGDGPPVEIFTIHKVRTRDPDRPKGREMLLGLACFTDKGVCFIQIGHMRRPGDALLILYFLLIGLFVVIIMLIREEQEKRKRQDAYFRGEVTILEVAESLSELLQLATQVIFYPRESIRDIRINSGGFALKLHKGRKRFAVDRSGHDFKRYRAVAKAYRQAIRRGGDLLSACKPHVTDETPRALPELPMPTMPPPPPGVRPGAPPPIPQ
ncbi:MAG TPA: hypothetical protein VNA25_24840 [Phycisphaerae bacterium]|nr:hypothetical protein [Phycisphaerae bacterium]